MRSVMCVVCVRSVSCVVCEPIIHVLTNPCDVLCTVHPVHCCLLAIIHLFCICQQFICCLCAECSVSCVCQPSRLPTVSCAIYPVCRPYAVNSVYYLSLCSVNPYWFCVCADLPMCCLVCCPFSVVSWVPKVFVLSFVLSFPCVVLLAVTLMGFLSMLCCLWANNYFILCVIRFCVVCVPTFC